MVSSFQEVDVHGIAHFIQQKNALFNAGSSELPDFFYRFCRKNIVEGSIRIELAHATELAVYFFHSRCSSDRTNALLFRKKVAFPVLQLNIVKNSLIVHRIRETADNADNG